MSYIFKKDLIRQSNEEDMVGYFYMNNGKPAFIRGIHKKDSGDKRGIIQVLLNLRASNYKYTVLAHLKETFRSTPVKLYEDKTSEGYILSDLLYDTNAIKSFKKDNYIDLTFKFKKDHTQEHYIFRFYDFKEYKKAEKVYLANSSHLVEDHRHDHKFPRTTIIIKVLPNG